MSEQTPGSASNPLSLPDAPNLEWLRKAAKHRLAELRRNTREAKLADAQLDIAKQYGFSSWRALKTHIDSLTVEGQLLEAARKGNVSKLIKLLDAHPEKLDTRDKPYGHTLLHLSAHKGHLRAVDLLLARGIDPNVRENGDNTYPMHWAAAAGNLDVVRRLADAGGDVVGSGDDHALEVIGWATGWDGCDDDAHRAVADFLVSRGARHHIYSAIAVHDDQLIRRLVAEDPSELSRAQSRNEDFRLPLHFAVQKGLPRIVKLLLDLGADPFATDGSGFTASAYATAPDVDRSLMEAIRDRTGASLFTAVALGDWGTAAQLMRADPGAIDRDGLLHLMAKRGNVVAVKWLLDHGSNPNGRWDHWDSSVTPLHLAILGDHAEVARLLLDAGADPAIHDSKHDGSALDWAEFMGRQEIMQLIKKNLPAQPRSVAG
jgi:ankyrin repeat protein